jgi:hypothetical protein
MKLIEFKFIKYKINGGKRRSGRALKHQESKNIISK